MAETAAESPAGAAKGQGDRRDAGMSLYTSQIGKLDLLWRLVVIVKHGDKLLLVRRPLQPVWHSLVVGDDLDVIEVTKEVKLRYLAAEQHCCLAVPECWGWLTGLLHETLFPAALSERTRWLRRLIRPFVGERLSRLVEVCGFHTLEWATDEGTFPVVVQVLQVPEEHARFSTEDVDRDRKSVV